MLIVDRSLFGSCLILLIIANKIVIIGNINSRKKQVVVNVLSAFTKYLGGNKKNATCGVRIKMSEIIPNVECLVLFIISGS